MKLRYFSEVLAEHPRMQAGWHADGNDVIIENPDYGVIVHVTVCRDDGHPLYDLPVWAEPPGAIVVPVTLDQRLVLIENVRPIPPAAGRRGAYPPGDLSFQGRVSLEFPRGFPLPGEPPHEAARREAEEETGLHVLEVTQIGECNPNTTYYLTNHPVFLARVEGAPIATHADAHEDIRALHLLSPPQALAMVAQDKIICALTKAALLHYLARASAE